MKFLQLSILALGLACLAEAQLTQKRPDPVPILKQISKQNDDGSYSFGYEAGDGSYKIETKFPNGEVQGKYGYVDDEGKLREVEYGATSKQGFRPQGNGINIPPPPSANDVQVAPLAEGEEDDGQYREDPSIYDTKEYKANRPVTQKGSRRPPLRIFQESTQPAQPIYQQPAQQQTYRQPAQQQTYRQPASTFSFASFPQNSFQYQQPSQNLDYEDPQDQYSVYQRPTGFTFQNPSAGRFFNNYQTQPQPQPQPQYQTYTQPQYQSYQQPQPVGFNFHPSIRNFDIGTGSYSINYSGR